MPFLILGLVIAAVAIVAGDSQTKPSGSPGKPAIAGISGLVLGHQYLLSVAPTTQLISQMNANPLTALATMAQGLAADGWVSPIPAADRTSDTSRITFTATWNRTTGNCPTMSSSGLLQYMSVATAEDT